MNSLTGEQFVGSENGSVTAGGTESELEAYVANEKTGVALPERTPYKVELPICTQSNR